MSMSDAYTECENRGIDPAAPGALQKLWAALSLSERAEVFPFAKNYGSPTIEPMTVGGWVLSEPVLAEWRMWNGTSTRVFQIVRPRALVRAPGSREYLIRYTSGEEATSSHRELYESSHVVAAPAEPLGDRMRKWVEAGMPRPWPLSPGEPVLAFAKEADVLHQLARAVRSDASRPLPVRGKLTFPPEQDAARARVLAAEHVRRARIRLTPDVPEGGRPWRPGDTPRLTVLREAADTLAKLCAVYLGAREGSPRNQTEAHAYALAFRLVEASARRLAMRRLR